MLTQAPCLVSWPVGRWALPISASPSTSSTVLGCQSQGVAMMGVNEPLIFPSHPSPWDSLRKEKEPLGAGNL